ncbi:MAG TPA: helix-turn-helix transcriptional regulator [Thermoplasmata archaeon]|nr:helix-turn-helix transcriptional regulator [Thermoplasmata archaeon]
MSEPQLASRPSKVAEARGLIEALAREYSVEILQELHARGWSSASELAREMGIHIATAMRKLAELETLGLLEKRSRLGADVMEYRLAIPRIEIVLDFEADAKAASRDAWRQAERIFVKEHPDRKVVLESDDRARRVRRILFLKVLRRRTEARTLELAEAEGAFLWHIPFASEPARSVAELCRRGGIENALQVSRILEFVTEMERMGVVDVAR